VSLRLTLVWQSGAVHTATAERETAEKAL